MSRSNRSTGAPIRPPRGSRRAHRVYLSPWVTSHILTSSGSTWLVYLRATQMHSGDPGLTRTHTKQREQSERARTRRQWTSPPRLSRRRRRRRRRRRWRWRRSGFYVCIMARVYAPSFVRSTRSLARVRVHAHACLYSFNFARARAHNTQTDRQEGEKERERDRWYCHVTIMSLSVQ